MDIKRLARYRPRVAAVFGLLALWTATACSGQAITVTSLPTPASVGSRQHNLAVDGQGGVLLSWVEGKTDRSRVRFARLQDGGWSEPRTIVEERRNLAAAPIVQPLGDGTLVAAWMTHLEQAGNQYAAEIHLARSDDAGARWTRLATPYSPQARIYDAQMALKALDQGFAIVWTDQRAAESEKRHQMLASIVGREGRAGAEQVVDDDVCSCCETSLAAQGDDWLLAYRDRRHGEVRDTSLARWKGGTLTSHTVPGEGWVIDGCPSNGPALDWKRHRVVVAWFTAADGVGRVRAAFSNDDGETFGSPVQVEADASGYVKTLLLDDGSAFVAWRGRAGAVEELRVARLRADGQVEDRTVVHRGDFPRWPSKHLSLVRSGPAVYVAWTDAAGPQVRLARIELPRRPAP